jgi:hypothetical protein
MADPPRPPPPQCAGVRQPRDWPKGARVVDPQGPCKEDDVTPLRTPFSDGGYLHTMLRTTPQSAHTCGAPEPRMVRKRAASCVGGQAPSMLRLGHALHLIPPLLDGDEWHTRDLADAPLELAIAPAAAVRPGRSDHTVGGSEACTRHPARVLTLARVCSRSCAYAHARARTLTLAQTAVRGTARVGRRRKRGAHVATI